MTKSIFDSSLSIEKDMCVVCLIETKNRNLLILEDHKSDNKFIDIMQFTDVPVETSFKPSKYFGEKINESILINRVNMENSSKKSLLHQLCIEDGAESTIWLCPIDKINRLYEILRYTMPETIQVENLNYISNNKETKYIPYVFLKYFGINLPTKLLSEVKNNRLDIVPGASFFVSSADSSNNSNHNKVVVKHEYVGKEELLLKKIEESEKKLLTTTGKDVRTSGPNSSKQNMTAYKI